VSDPLLTIALDGPAASGKSTVALIVAARLGWLYFDTGAMYRAITYLAVYGEYPLANGEVLGDLAATTLIEIEPPTANEQDGRQYTVRVNDEDITWGLREQRIEQHVSTVAAHPAVRSALKAQQRRIGLRGRVIMVGRDIGTVVLPEAPLKIYLDASVEERARRRCNEILARGEVADYEQILADMRSRDARDSSRATAPLRPAEDAILLNSDDMGIEAVAESILELAQERFGVWRNEKREM
jgi:cytidylate kinase